MVRWALWAAHVAVCPYWVSRSTGDHAHLGMTAIAPFSLILSEGSTESAWIAALGIGAVAPVTDRAFNAGLQ